MSFGLRGCAHRELFPSRPLEGCHSCDGDGISKVLCLIGVLKSALFQPNVISNANKLAFPLLMQPTERAGHDRKADSLSRGADAITMRVSEACNIL